VLHTQLDGTCLLLFFNRRKRQLEGQPPWSLSLPTHKTLCDAAVLCDVYKIGEELEDVATDSFVPFGSFLSESQAVGAHTDAASYRFVRSKCVGYASGQTRVILPLLLCLHHFLIKVDVCVGGCIGHSQRPRRRRQQPLSCSVSTITFSFCRSLPCRDSVVAGYAWRGSCLLTLFFFHRE
jgi:hypothetical protein